MSTPIHLSEFTENLEVEAKLARGRDGQGALPESIWETYSAFANTHGGTIFLGVGERHDQFFADGIPCPEQVEEALWEGLNDPARVSHNLLDRSQVRTHCLPCGQSIVIIVVPQAPRELRPIHVGGSLFDGSYKRHESGDYHLEREEVEHMLAERG
jgi:predicted HTH transcriptional regulator